MDTAGDPRVSKPRLPKAYTEEQLAFLKSHIAGFETRTKGHVRGDAKKFALDRASEFLLRFGLPPDLQGVDEAEPRFREQIYNWYKNTVGRARRKLEGRTRPKKLSDKPGSVSWSPTLASFPSPPEDQHLHPHADPPPQPATQQLQFFPSPSQTPTTAIALSVTPSALREAFLVHTVDLPTLSSLIHSYVVAHPSPTPLTPVIHTLFDAATSLLASPTPTSTSASTSSSGSTSPSTSGVGRTDVLLTLLRRFIDACAFFPNTLVHADVSGPLAGPRALQTALRKSSVWTPSSTNGIGTTGSLSDEMERIKVDRQRRKDHVQWAQLHAAAIELGIVGGVRRSGSGLSVSVAGVGVGVVNTNGAGYHLRAGQQELTYGVPSSHTMDTFSEMMVRDAVWESDEVEWVAGIIVLRAIIQTGGASRKVEWEQLLVAYERRWKEIKDEARQALVTEVLLGAREDLAHLEDVRIT